MQKKFHFESVHFDQIDSTNSEAVRRVNEGQVSTQTVFWADTQTAGRGTRGRDWQSQKGNVHATYVFPLAIDLKKAPLIVYSIALAVHDTLADFIKGPLVQIKWPNDILVNERKISGSLHEIIQYSGTSFFVAGIGINNDWKPESDVLYPACCISDFCNEALMVSTLVQRLGSNVFKRVTEIEERGFEAQKTQFLKHSYMYGETLQIRLRGDRQDGHSGVFEGIDENGALMLRTSKGIQRFVAGDIFPSLAS